MSERRSVLGRRGQLLVALPAVVRRHLDLSPSAVVYWHVSRNGEVTLSLAERRPGGRPSADADCARCEERQRELVRLRGLLHSRDAADGARYFGQGYQAAIRHHGNLDAKLDTALDHLRELLGRAPRRRPHRKPQAAPSGRDVVEVVATPKLEAHAEANDESGRLLDHAHQG